MIVRDLRPAAMRQYETVWVFDVDCRDGGVHRIEPVLPITCRDCGAEPVERERTLPE